MAHHMGGHTLLGWTRTLRCGDSDIAFYNVAKSRGGKGCATGIEEDFRCGSATAQGQPSPQCARCFLPERQSTLLSGFSSHQDAGIGTIELDVVEMETHEFGNTQSCGETKIEHRLVTDSAAFGGIWSIENGLHFLAG